MKSCYPVGECARYCGVTTRTLRYYDELGIVKPCKIDPESGYRYYSEEQIDKVHFAQILKELGLSLEEIREKLKTIDARRFLEITSARKRELYKEKSRIQKQLQKTERLESDLREALGSPMGTCFVSFLTARSGVFIPLSSQNKYEQHGLLHRLEKEYGFGTLPGNVRRVISEENLKKGNYLDYTGYFIGEEDVPDSISERIFLPDSLVAVSYCPVERSESGPYWERLLAFIRDNGYEIAGDAFKTIVLEKGISARENEYISRFSVPIKRVGK